MQPSSRPEGWSTGQLQAWEKLREKGVEVQVLNISCLSDLDIEAILKAAKTGTSHHL